jgi:hypothetical protein
MNIKEIIEFVKNNVFTEGKIELYVLLYHINIAFNSSFFTFPDFRIAFIKEILPILHTFILK